MSASHPEYDLDLKIAELRINGFVTFEDLMPVEKINAIRVASSDRDHAV